MRVAMTFRIVAAFSLTLVSVGAEAEPGNSATISGSSAAEIVDPGALNRLDDLRFGAFASPATRATMTITPGGTITATGEVATTMNLFTSATGRGPARFRIQGTNNRLFIPFIPNRLTISNGTSTMLVDRLDDNVNPVGRFDADGRFIYQVGGRLNVGANQEPGNYRGEFQLTVIFN